MPKTLSKRSNATRSAPYSERSQVVSPSQVEEPESPLSSAPETADPQSTVEDPCEAIGTVKANLTKIETSLGELELPQALGDEQTEFESDATKFIENLRDLRGKLESVTDKDWPCLKHNFSLEHFNLAQRLWVQEGRGLMKSIKRLATKLETGDPSQDRHQTAKEVLGGVRELVPTTSQALNRAKEIMDKQEMWSDYCMCSNDDKSYG